MLDVALCKADRSRREHSRGQCKDMGQVASSETYFNCKKCKYNSIKVAGQAVGCGLAGASTAGINKNDVNSMNTDTKAFVSLSMVYLRFKHLSCVFLLCVLKNSV